MIINKKRIISLDFLRNIKTNNIVLAAPLDSISKYRLGMIGFQANPNIGDTILPSAIGPVSKRNSEGEYIIHKDQKKETHYRTIEWTWQQWKGRGETEEISDFRDVPYERYPRTFIKPYAIELTIAVGRNNTHIIISPQFNIKNDKDYIEIKHTINLFLELFKECYILTEGLEQIHIPKITRLNWDILPPGEYPWEQRYKQVEPFIKKAPKGNWPVIENRLEIINNYKPDFAAIGINGFSGYIVFGFNQKGLYVFESTKTNNATYVFDKNWKDLSLLTKKEILNNELHQMRVIHRVKTWENEINNILN